MEKIQTEVVSMLRAGAKAGGSYRTSGTDAAFGKLLKEQSQGTDGGTKEAAASGTDSPGKAPEAGKEETKPVKESGTKGKTEDAKEEDGVKSDGLVLPSELLLKLQEQTGVQMAVPTEAEAQIPELTKESPEILVQPEPLTGAGGLPLQAGDISEAQELSGMAETAGLSGGEEVRTVRMPAEKQELQAEEAVFGQDKKILAGTVEKQTQPREVPGSMTEPEKTEIPVKASAAETKEGTREQAGQEQPLAGMEGQPIREYAARETGHVVSEPVRTSEPNLINDVGRAIAQRLPASDGTLTIELEPASLGKMTIRVLYESGKATVSILATSPRTLELLSARAGELASILEERTGQETVVYAEQPESEQPFDERQGEGRQKDREPEGREHKERNEQDSFLQQLRLGVI